MGYVTLLLHEAELIEGGMYVDQGTEQCHDRTAAMPVTLHEEDLKRGTFVQALFVHGHAVPFTWTYDGGDHRAVQRGDATMYGGTLEQFVYKRGEQARFSMEHGFSPNVVEHKPREDD